MALLLKLRRALPLALFLLLGACGTNVGSAGNVSYTPAGSQPDRVQVQVAAPSASEGKRPLLTLVQTSLIHHLYSAVLALPQMPQSQPCTDELGPSYMLVFFHGGQRLLALSAQRFSCQMVTVEGSAREKRATSDFWQLVDQVIYAATPVGTPEWLALLRRPQMERPPLTARVAAVETTRRLYNAILRLSLAPASSDCAESSAQKYSLLFHQADFTIPALISDQCNTIELQGDYRTRSGTFRMTSAFKQLLEQTLAAAAPVLARPDQLALTMQAGNSTASRLVVSDAVLVQRIYSKAFLLPLAPASLPQNCDEQDKVNGRGRWYTFEFRQWGLLLLSMELFEGSCKLITLYPSGRLVWGDASFWSAIHQAARV